MNIVYIIVILFTIFRAGTIQIVAFTNKKLLRGMQYRIKLKNSEECVILDGQVYDELSSDPYLSKIKFLANLRRHSSGCAVFQKTRKKETGRYETETIYLHKLIAERYLVHTATEKKNLVGAINGNKLDCRLANLEYRSRAVASRKRKTSSKVGYTGVYKEHNRYRAVISINRKSVHLGMFATAEEAALAYNAKSLELYGKNGKLNKIKPTNGPDFGGRPRTDDGRSPESAAQAQFRSVQ